LKTHSYLAQSRNGVYYARFIVPKSLRVSGDLRREIRVSTATKDPRDAAARARALRVLLDQMFYSGALCSRDPFDDADMKTIFESPYMVQAQYLHAYQYWIPLVSAFTGARIGEVSQLHIADVIEIDGIPMFDITDNRLGNTHEHQ